MATLDVEAELEPLRELCARMDNDQKQRFFMSLTEGILSGGARGAIAGQRLGYDAADAIARGIATGVRNAAQYGY